MIREATAQDVPQLVEMGRQFRASTPYAGLIAENPDQMHATACDLIASPQGAIWVAEDKGGALVGMIGLLAFTHHLSGERTVGELFLWVDPGSRGTIGVRLLKQAYVWAQAQGATKIQMTAPNHEVGELYERLGYQAIETAWQREVA